MFKVIVAGSREFDNYGIVEFYLDKYLKNVGDDITIVSGAARGVDTLGEQYAENRGYEVERHPAEWKKQGKSAGYKRNAEMAKNADALVAFWDGESRGTQHMIDIAEREGLYRRLVRIEEVM